MTTICRHAVLLLFLLLLTTVTARSSSAGCPKKCFCNAQIVYCSRRGFTAIPNDVPEAYTQLNLNGNQFTSHVLERANLSKFPRLEHLYLSECGLRHVTVGAFRDLQRLKWLDMSNNHLQSVEPLTFMGVTLQHLFLNGNRGLQLGPRSFEGLETKGLYLHDNALQKISAQVLAPLNETMKYLWLNGNELQQMDADLVSVFAGLEHLRLGGNPLDCSCAVRGLKRLFDQHRKKFDGAAAPTCAAPSALRGTSFTTLSLAQIICAPPVFTNIDAQLGAREGALRCTARGDPAPTLYWIQPNGHSRKFPPPRDKQARRSSGVLRLVRRRRDEAHRKDLAQHQQLAGAYMVEEGSSGMYICVAHNEWGNVTLTFNVTLPAVRQPEVTRTPEHDKVIRLAGIEVPRSRDREQSEDSVEPRAKHQPAFGRHKPRDRLESRDRHEPRDRHKSRDRPHRGKHKHHSGGKKRKQEDDLSLGEPWTERAWTDWDYEQHANDGPGHHERGPGQNGIPEVSLEQGREKPAGSEAGYNLTGLALNGSAPTFTLLELVGACVGTFVSTLLLCLIVLPLYLRRRWAHPPSGLEKPPKSDLYLNGLGAYMDTPSHTYMDPNELHIHR